MVSRSDRGHEVDAKVWARRLLAAQPVRFGSVAMNRDGRTHQVPALHVAAVLRALADHTAVAQMLAVADHQLLRRRDDNGFAPRERSVGRFFHALADEVEQLAGQSKELSTFVQEVLGIELQPWQQSVLDDLATLRDARG